MKTTIVILSLLMTTLAFAAPAAAECTSVPETGTLVCEFVQDPNNFNVLASQGGVGGASADAYEFTFFGQTFRGKSATVYTDPSGPAGYNSVAFSEFCFASGGACTFQDDSVFVSSQHAGFAFVGVSQSPDGRVVCFGAADQFGCQGF